MKGFVKVPAIDFDTLNNEWTVRANQEGIGCDSYTYLRPDIDPDYVWARIEHEDFTELTILTKEEAIIRGMVE